MAIELTGEQIEAFHRDGFLALPALSTAAEIERLRAVYDRLFAADAGQYGGDHLSLATADADGRQRLPQIMNPETYAPELLETEARANAAAVAQQLLGPDITRAGDHAILKPPRYGAETPWHQDEAYWNPGFDHDAISIWMPLQEATIANGCMQFIPGSHALPVVQHRLADPDAHALVTLDPVSTETAVACPIPAGGCTIHHCRTLHFTGANNTDDPRRAYIMGFSAPPVKLPEPHDYHWQRVEWTA